MSIGKQMLKLEMQMVYQEVTPMKDKRELRLGRKTSNCQTDQPKSKSAQWRTLKQRLPFRGASSHVK